MLLIRHCVALTGGLHDTRYIIVACHFLHFCDTTVALQLSPIAQLPNLAKVTIVLQFIISTQIWRSCSSHECSSHECQNSCTHPYTLHTCHVDVTNVSNAHHQNGCIHQSRPFHQIATPLETRLLKSPHPYLDQPAKTCKSYVPASTVHSAFNTWEDCGFLFAYTHTC